MFAGIAIATLVLGVVAALVARRVASRVKARQELTQANTELLEVLRQAEWRFRTLFRAAPDAVLTVLPSGRIRDANDAVRDLLQLDPHYVVGRMLADFVFEDDRVALDQAISDAFAGSPQRLEIRFVSAGTTRVVQMAASRVPEAEPPTVLCIGRDISSEREMRTRLLETERLAAVGELVAGVAHEVNNPLSSISAYAQLLLRDDGLTEQQRESVEVIRTEAHRASQVVKDLLAFSRRSGTVSELLDINMVVERSLRLRGYQLATNSIRVVTDLTPDLPPVTGDPRQLQQVVLNLVTNAIQAMAPGSGGGTAEGGAGPAHGGAGRELRIGTREEDGCVVLEVSDNGCGVQADARPHIFEPFFTTKKEGEGTGLGLSVSYGIITAHGGTIALADTSGRGSTFIVRLPAQR